MRSPRRVFVGPKKNRASANRGTHNALVTSITLPGHPAARWTRCGTGSTVRLREKQREILLIELHREDEAPGGQWKETGIELARGYTVGPPARSLHREAPRSRRVCLQRRRTFRRVATTGGEFLALRLSKDTTTPPSF